jgi:hypothetical protein
MRYGINTDVFLQHREVRMSDQTLPFLFEVEMEERASGPDVESLYSRVIRGCQERNKSRVYQTLMDLIQTLDFNHRPVAIEQFRAYESCIRLARANRFSDVATIIQRLRQPWPYATMSMMAN